jgi:hypothetical protein
LRDFPGPRIYIAPFRNEAKTLSIAGATWAAIGGVKYGGMRKTYRTMSVLESLMTWIPFPTLWLLPANSHPKSTRTFRKALPSHPERESKPLVCVVDENLQAVLGSSAM